jgi:DNA (cytosine-5)-methyltransferase 1
MEELGYRNYAKVLNAKDYGIPQNRERVYTMSIRNDIPGPFKFPEPEPLTKKLKDVLEDSVDEKYYLSDEQMASFKASTEKQRAKGYGFAFKPRSTETYAYTISTRAGQRKTDNFVKIFGNLNQPGWRKENGAVLSGDEISPTIMAQSNNAIKKVAIRTANKLGFDLATDGDGIDLAYPQSTTRRGRVGHGVAKTLATSDSQGTLDGFRIRKLTPKECWRLMGFDDADFEKAEKVNSNTQLYKQAGNSIVVNVLEKILANLPDGAK